MLYSQLYVLCSNLKSLIGKIFEKINSIINILHVTKITHIVEMGIKTEGT
jgi:hypothetical protein